MYLPVAVIFEYMIFTNMIQDFELLKVSTECDRFVPCFHLLMRLNRSHSLSIDKTLLVHSGTIGAILHVQNFRQGVHHLEDRRRFSVGKLDKILLFLGPKLGR